MRKIFIGFILSFSLILISFYLKNSCFILQYKRIYFFIIYLFSLIHVFLHYFFFLRQESYLKCFWNSITLIFTILIINILFFGSIWIMYNLNENMKTEKSFFTKDEKVFYNN
ncbi:hypothetical protein AOQ88_00525 [Candidatus Riesia sp. GBBU]|nr:hypothetical protein AOQ88_00525 [Candidatus Riesia sp. GBBU]